MALDTQAKRASAIHVSLPWRGAVPVPDGAIGQGDRQAIAYYCAAVLMANGVVAGPYIVGRGEVYQPSPEKRSRASIYSPSDRAATYTPSMAKGEIRS